MKPRKLICFTLGSVLLASCLVSLLKAQNPPAAANSDEMVTTVYKVPATFLSIGRSNAGSSGGGGAADPFADPAESKGSGTATRLSSREILESVGVTLPEGASAIYNPETGELIVRNTRDQHELVQAYLDSIVDAGERQIQVIVEFIEVEHLDFSDWVLSNHFDQSGTPLRKAAQEWVRDGRGEVIETATVLARSGQRAKVESISEHIYATEYDPPVVPEEVTLGEDSDAPMTDVTPTAFETRNLGTTLEVDPVLGADSYTIDLNLSPEMVQLEGATEWTNENYEGGIKLEMPLFYAMKVTTQVTLHDGTYQLIGTTRPMKDEDAKRKNAIVLVFVRADVLNLNKWSTVEPE